MSFENLTLPNLLLADLYKNIQIIPTPSIDINHLDGNSEDSRFIKFLGNNARNITILVNHSSELIVPDRHLDFLTRILLACKLNIGDVAIVNEGNKFVDINTIQEYLSPQCLILFGIDPLEIKLPLNFPHFKIQQHANTTYLSVPSLDQLNIESEESKLLKTKLWVCLKSLFEVTGQNK